ncbi:MAG: hypothetical protein R3A80_01105 [Bdellovibrionota bacterium]
MLRVLLFISFFSVGALKADDLINCLLRLQTTRHTMNFAEVISTRSLNAEEKQLLHDFAQKHTKYKDSPEELEKFFKEVDAITPHDSVEEVIAVMEYRLASRKDLETIKAELVALQDDIPQYWKERERSILPGDIDQQVRWNSLLIFQRAQHENKAAFVQIRDLLISKGDDPNEVAAKLEVLLDTGNFDASFALRYEKLEEIFKVTATPMGIASKPQEMKPTTQQVFQSYILYSIMSKNGKGFDELSAAVNQAKRLQGDDIHNVGNLLYWTTRQLEELNKIPLRTGGRIITLGDFVGGPGRP